MWSRLSPSASHGSVSALDVATLLLRGSYRSSQLIPRKKSQHRTTRCHRPDVNPHSFAAPHWVPSSPKVGQILPPRPHRSDSARRLIPDTQCTNAGCGTHLAWNRLDSYDRTHHRNHKLESRSRDMSRTSKTHNDWAIWPPMTRIGNGSVAGSSS